MRISDWSSDVCSSDLVLVERRIYAFHASEPDSRPPPVSFSPPNAPPISAPDVPIFTLAIPQSEPDADRNVSASRRFMVNTADRSEEHTSELQSLMRISYAVFCLKKKTKHRQTRTQTLIYSKKYQQ